MSMLVAVAENAGEVIDISEFRRGYHSRPVVGQIWEDYHYTHPHVFSAYIIGNEV